MERATHRTLTVLSQINLAHTSDPYFIRSIWILFQHLRLNIQKASFPQVVQWQFSTYFTYLIQVPQSCSLTHLNLLSPNNKNVFPVNTMKTFRGRRGRILFILVLGTRWRWAVKFTSWPAYPPPQEITRNPLKQGLGGPLDILENRKISSP